MSSANFCWLDFYFAGRNILAVHGLEYNLPAKSDDRADQPGPVDNLLTVTILVTDSFLTGLEKCGVAAELRNEVQAELPGR
jgi:hypothetical protein